MFIKNLKIYGFKTFGKKVSIDFQKGITAIVGPNGSGKTNLIDALNWVVGDTKMADLRVKTSQQLIFHGTPSLKPLSLAEVSLTIENSMNHLPIDYNEVNITRRVTKDGVSEYFINKNKCALKDITNLFLDTGVGKGAYSVMKQGEIDRLLKQKPEERREIFEQASGILKYRNRRRETEKDLERAENNLKQIRPIMLEVERQYNSKKKQAERAEKYNELIKRKDEIEIDINLIKIYELKKNVSSRKDLNEKQTEKKQKLLEKIKRIEDEINDSITQSKELQTAQYNIQKDILQKEGVLSSIKQKIGMLEEKKSSLENNVENWKNSVKKNKEKIKKIEELVIDLEKEKANLENMIIERQDNLEKYAKDIEAINKIVVEDTNNIEKYKKLIIETDDSLLEARNNLGDVVNKLVEEIDKRKAELKGSAESKQNLKNNIEHSFGELILFLKSKKEIINDLMRSDFLEHSKKEKIKDILNNLSEGLNLRIEDVGKIKEQFAQLDNLISGFDEIIFAREGIHSKKEQIDLKIDELNRNIRAYQKRITDLETDKINQMEKIEAIKQMMHESQISLVQMREKAKSNSKSIETQKNFRKEVESQSESVTNNIERALEEIKNIDKQVQDEKEGYDKLSNKQDELKKELTNTSKNLSNVIVNSSEKEKKLLKLKEDLETLHEKIEAAIRGLTTYEVEIRTIYDNFYENYSIDLKEHEASMKNKRFDMAALRTELKKIKEEIKALGNINPMALDEYRELEERFKLLKEQITDIEKSRKNLESIIKEINKNSEEIFHDTFSKIKVNFYHIFRRLFNGGRAELNLTDPDNILESGVEILVQPPSKSLQTVALLSGGESSMTAIALLFAIFMVRPSPFCLLDEIDAALDVPNIERFKSLLGEFRESTQFLIISHNINTLKAADAIYGISMEEEGVTTAISLNINDIEKHKRKYIQK